MYDVKPEKRLAGNAMVEFVILLPLYLLLLLGVVYLGQVAFFQERSLEANRLATLMPGNQSESPRVRGVVAQSLFEPGVGQLTLTEINQELPTWVDVERILYPPPRPVVTVATSATATGYTDIDLDSLQDDLETVIQGQPVSPPPPPPPPSPPYRDIRLINVLHDLMRNWVQRTSSQSQYRYEPKYLSLEHVRLPPAEPSAQHRVVSRTGSAREVRGPRGENLSPGLVNQLLDGRAPVTGFPYFSGFPQELMSPN
jgi:hypothetical protein